MAESVFSETGKQNFIDRINQLTPAAQRQWGKMNAAQMLKHCRLSIEDTLGKPDNGKKSSFIKMTSFLFGKMAKKQTLQGNEMKKNMPTAQAFIVKENPDFETEKKNLIAAIETLQKRGGQQDLAHKHPFFGTMSLQDWDLLHTKHLQHHLSQFGV